MMNRRDFFKTVGFGAAATMLGGNLPAAPAASKRKPNVVLILVDDLGWTDLGCFGSKYYETPNIDKLAAGGMKFTNGYAACAVCSPTRAAVMTGRYPARLGVTDWIRSRFQGGKIPADKKNPSGYTGGRDIQCPKNALWMESEEITIAEALKPAGYVSCHIGKWHLGADDWYPERQGFDQNFGGCDYGQPPSYFDPYKNKRLANIPTLKPRKEGEYLTDREGDEAVGFIRANKDKPFFLYLANYAVHTPIQGKKNLIEKYSDKTPTNQKNPTYAAMVESVDDSVGKVMAVLDELKLTEDTLVIFSSDNGGLMGPTNNKPLRSGKGNPYEGGIRVPYIFRKPGLIKAGSVCDTPVISVDFMPTICATVGIAPPAGREIDGEDLTPLLTQSGKLKRTEIYWHFPHFRGRIMPYSIIRQGDWKLLKRYAGSPEFELFNLAKDLSETKDLAPDMPEKVKDLNAKLVAALKKQGAKIPRPNPNPRPAGKKKKKK
ncbi:MAG: sulfatase-like hydrolase/transferase [Phycisphaerae bacterium]|jgi:arylsulfatase A-like enzyme|nr:sulfatase-like hydrolase/transferase [Phycisphaerae bacterium]